MSRASRALVIAALVALSGAPAASDAKGRESTGRPEIDAPAATLEDGRTGHVLLAKSPRERRPIASTTKLMTALLTLERTRPGEVFVARGYRAAAVESQIGLEEGERMRVRDLLTALLLESANDAAATLAREISGSEDAFVDEMNQRARELGLRDTHYENPIGFDDPANYSSARDLAALARVLLRDRRFEAIVRRPRAVLKSGDRRRVVENRNTLVGRYPRVDGVKTGHTAKAGYVLVGSATGRGAQVVSVVLGAADEEARDVVSRALLTYGLDQFRRRTVLRAGRPVASAGVAGRDGEAALTTPSDVVLTVRRGGAVRTSVSAPDELEGPLAPGSRVGSVEVLYGDEVAKTAPLVTAGAVAEPATVARVTAALRGPLTWIALAAIVLASALAIFRIRSTTPARRAADDHHGHT